MRLSSFLSGLPHRTRIIGVFVASGGQHIQIQAAEGYKASTASWAFVRRENLVHGKKR